MSHQPFLIPLKESSKKKFANILPRSDKILLFDIDNTLYCESTGLMNYIQLKIHEYAVRKGIPPNNVKTVCKQYNKEYGLALKGFMKHFPETDPNEFDMCVDGGTNLQMFLKEDLELKNILKGMSYKMYCFTNANYKHAMKVLEALGIVECFSGIFYCEYKKHGEFICKPDIFAYNIIEELLGKPSIYFYEDSINNIKIGEQMGWYCELIDKENNIKSVLKRFIEKEHEEKKVVSQSITDEISRRFEGDLQSETFTDCKNEGIVPEYKENK